MIVPPEVVARIKAYLEERYAVGELMAVLGTSRYKAGLARKGCLDWPMFLKLRERLGLEFVCESLAISPADLAVGGALSLLARHERECRDLRLALERAQGGPEALAPEETEIPVADLGSAIGSPMARWLARFEAQPRTTMAALKRLVRADPSGRVGLQSRSRSQTHFTCQHIGTALNFRNAGSVRLLGASTADWSSDPYLAACAAAYARAADLGRPVLQQVRIRSSRGLMPDEPAYRRLCLPFRDFRQSSLVVVITEAVYPT